MWGRVGLEDETLDVLQRALALRAEKKIGALWASGGCLWVSGNEEDPYGSREMVSVERLRKMVERAEGLKGI